MIPDGGIITIISAFFYWSRGSTWKGSAARVGFTDVWGNEKTPTHWVKAAVTKKSWWSWLQVLDINFRIQCKVVELCERLCTEQENEKKKKAGKVYVTKYSVQKCACLSRFILLNWLAPGSYCLGLHGNMVTMKWWMSLSVCLSICVCDTERERERKGESTRLCVCVSVRWGLLTGYIETGAGVVLCLVLFSFTHPPSHMLFLHITVCWQATMTMPRPEITNLK